MRRAPAAIIALALIAGVLWVAATPAHACFCAGPPRTPEDAARIASEADLVFIGHQVQWRAGPPPIATVEITASFTDEIAEGEIIEVGTGQGGADCGTGDLGEGDRGFALTRTDDGLLAVSICGSLVDPLLLRHTFEPLPDPSGTGSPSFVAATRIGDARVAVLDRRGAISAWGRGVGRLAALAACPGGHRLIEIVEPPDLPTGEIGGDRPPRLELRDLATMEIVESHEIPLSVRSVGWSDLLPWVRDVQCHDSDGIEITYLLPTGVWDELSDAPLTGEATMHRWQGGTLSEIELGRARTLAVDPERGVLWTITGDDGRWIETRSLDGDLLDSTTLPDEGVGWLAALNPTTRHLGLLARHAPLDRVNWYYPEVDRLFTLDTEGRMWPTDLPTGRARAIHPSGDGFTVVMAAGESSPSTVVHVSADGEATVWATMPGESWIGPSAAGSDVVLLGGLQVRPLGLVSVTPAGELTALDPVVWNPTAVAALQRSEEAVEIPSTTSPSPDQPTTSPATTKAPAPPDSSDRVAGDDTTARSLTSTALLVVIAGGLLGALLVASAAAAVTRRRRR